MKSEGKGMENNIIDKARELGGLLAESNEMTIYKAAEAKMQADEKSTKLMSEYKKLQIEMVKLTRGNAEKEAIEETKQKLLATQDEINSYEVTYNFLKSKADVEAMMKQVNDIIIFSITGETGCSDDKCKSCGGGCKG